MSKKNKRKFAKQPNSATAAAEDASVVAKKIEVQNPAKPQENGGYNMNKDLRSLAIIAIVLIALLIGLYYYDQQTHILQQLTDKLFALF